MLQTVKPGTVGNYNYNPPDLPGSGEPALNRLLPLFPSAKPANIPVRVGLPGRAKGACEKTTIMFRGHDTAIFSLTFPIYGGEALQLRAPSTARDTQAIVVALMPNGQGLAVAVRFVDELPKWFLKA